METGVPGEPDLSQVTDNLYHIKLCRIHLTISGIWTYYFSDDRYSFHRQFYFQLQYDHDYDGIVIMTQMESWVS
jgi:hypothetical protein